MRGAQRPPRTWHSSTRSGGPVYTARAAPRPTDRKTPSPEDPRVHRECRRPSHGGNPKNSVDGKGLESTNRRKRHARYLNPQRKVEGLATENCTKNQDQDQDRLLKYCTFVGSRGSGSVEHGTISVHLPPANGMGGPPTVIYLKRRGKRACKALSTWWKELCKLVYLFPCRC